VLGGVVFVFWGLLLGCVFSAFLGWGGLISLLARMVFTDWRNGNLLFLLQVLVLPAVFGAMLGFSLSAGWKNAVMRRLSLPVTHPVETGYDYWFGSQPDAGIVMISYFDGTVVAGYFGDRSLAASNPDRRDIFLEYLYGVDGDGEIFQPELRRSAIVSLDHVRSIEFLAAE